MDLKRAPYGFRRILYAPEDGNRHRRVTEACFVTVLEPYEGQASEFGIVWTKAIIMRRDLGVA